MSITEQIKAAKEQIKLLQSQVTGKSFDDKLTVKIGEKGTLNFYGLGKFPVCLYMSQLVRLNKLVNSPDFQKFIQDNAEKIAVKKAE